LGLDCPGADFLCNDLEKLEEGEGEREGGREGGRERWE